MKEKVVEFLTTDPTGQKMFQQMQDRYFTKGLETWKEKSLPKVIEQGVKNFQDSQLSNEQKHQLQVEELQVELGNKRKIKNLKDKCSELSLDDYFNVDTILPVLSSVDEESGMELLEKLSTHFEGLTQTLLEEDFKKKYGGKSPTIPRDSNSDMTKDKLLKMPYDDRVKFYKRNPELYNQIMRG